MNQLNLNQLPSISPNEISTFDVVMTKDSTNPQNSGDGRAAFQNFISTVSALVGSGNNNTQPQKHIFSLTFLDGRIDLSPEAAEGNQDFFTVPSALSGFKLVESRARTFNEENYHNESYTGITVPILKKFWNGNAFQIVQIGSIRRLVGSTNVTLQTNSTTIVASGDIIYFGTANFDSLGNNTSPLYPKGLSATFILQEQQSQIPT